jgi:polyisoprenoid-binding protein YceI
MKEIAMLSSLTRYGTMAALCALFLIPTDAQAQTYTLDPLHTSVIWNAGHFGFSAPHGIFSNIKGTLVIDEATTANSMVEATVPVTLVATGIEKFDDHLLGSDFFKADQFPTATFKSTSVEKTGDKTAKVTGDLTLLGVTKPVVLNVTFNKKGENPFSKKPTIGFMATGNLKRSDFGMTYAIPGVSDEVTLRIEAEGFIESPKTENQ